MDAKKEGIQTDGFRADLVSNGQGADVYRHIFGHLGATIIGGDKIIPGSWTRSAARKFFGDSISAIRVNETGNELSDRQLATDRRQANTEGSGDDKGPEAETEVRDDIAGRSIGRRIGTLVEQKTVSRDDWTSLRNFVKETLCE